MKSKKRTGKLPKSLPVLWWGRTDSNHRSKKQQIYSLPPLATRELPHVTYVCFCRNWSWWTDLNPRPADYKSAALPTELHQRCNDNYYIIAFPGCQANIPMFLKNKVIKDKSEINNAVQFYFMIIKPFYFSFQIMGLRRYAALPPVYVQSCRVFFVQYCLIPFALQAEKSML